MVFVQKHEYESPSVDVKETKQVVSMVDNQSQETSFLMASSESAQRPRTVDEGNNGPTIHQVA